MNLLKISALVLMFGCIESMMAHADDTVTLPTLQVLAEPELRKETGIVPYQNDEMNRRALQHQIIRNSREAQNFMIDSHVVANLEIQPLQSQPDLTSLPPLLQQHVLNIAQGLQSSDPTQGLYIMLQPFGIDRSNSMQPLERGTHLQINLNNINIGTLERSVNNPPLPVVPTPKMQ
ncbi:hypothetical protein B9T29_03695 [Acinetobacter sp. ANC 3903]|uniref:hypothetical protein n=1 Tax=Acinetobacter sp. ANC 3903 TaxID=1977883 RepID=UPI000A340DD7|nr:hypothetical protein [Acinetobacter sp. ANC 3903]OTG63285.1 hypothetical protein B9T29_03695 [Acinetobacter sp. ANC 3903]